MLASSSHLRCSFQLMYLIHVCWKSAGFRHNAKYSSRSLSFSLSHMPCRSSGRRACSDTVRHGLPVARESPHLKNVLHLSLIRDMELRWGGGAEQRPEHGTHAPLHTFFFFSLPPTPPFSPEHVRAHAHVCTQTLTSGKLVNLCPSST